MQTKIATSDSLRATLESMNQRMASSDRVVGKIEYAVVEEALTSGSSLTIKVVTQVRLSTDEDQSLTGLAGEGNGPKVFPVSAQLAIVERRLGSIDALTKYRHSGFSFIGTHHHSERWEANYNAGMAGYDEYTDYQIWVDDDGSATYEIKDKRVV